MSVSPLNLYIEMLIPNVMLLRGGLFGRQLDCEGRALTNAVRALITGVPENSLSLFLPCELAICNPEDSPHKNQTMPAP